MSQPQDDTTIEYLKAVIDHFKHLTTLSSGFILVMATFVENFFQQPDWQVLFVVAFVCFILSTLFSVIGQALYIDLVANLARWRTRNARLNQAVTVAAWALFMLGILTLVVFTVKNLV